MWSSIPALPTGCQEHPLAVMTTDVTRLHPVSPPGWWEQNHSRLRDTAANSTDNIGDPVPQSREQIGTFQKRQEERNGSCSQQVIHGTALRDQPAQHLISVKFIIMTNINIIRANVY